MPQGSEKKRLFKFMKRIVPIAKPGENREDDIIKLETLLERSGDMDLRLTDGPTGFYGQRLKDGIERFQERKNLKVDGTVNPGGETMRALATSEGASLTPETSLRPAGNKARTGLSALDRPSGPNLFKLTAGEPKGPMFQRPPSTQEEDEEPRLGSQATMERRLRRQQRRAEQLKMQQEDETEIEWNARPEMGKERRDTANRVSYSAYRTDGPMRIELEQHTFGHDGLDGFLTWWPLDERGKRQQLLTGPGGPSEELRVGKVSFIPNIVEGGGSKVVAPPFENPYGWELEIGVPDAQRTYNGNSGYKGIRVFKPRDNNRANE